MTGEVTPDHEAILPMEVCGPDGASIHLNAVVDTGFTDALTLPPPVVRSLSLLYRRSTEVGLGDGSIVIADVYDAFIYWNLQWRPIQVQEADTDPLIGMSLMQGSRLCIDVLDGGKLTIEPLP